MRSTDVSEGGLEALIVAALNPLNPDGIKTDYLWSARVPQFSIPSSW
jgi:hypothetical protein